MVEREEIEIRAKDAQELITAARISRGPNGEWTIILDVDGDVWIDDDRHLPLRGELRLKGRQKGRRPNPAWETTGKLRRRKSK
jgi:hypothetical protein